MVSVTNSASVPFGVKGVYVSNNTASRTHKQSKRHHFRGGRAGAAPEVRDGTPAAVGVTAGGLAGDGGPFSNTRASNFISALSCVYRAIDWVSVTVQVTPDELAGWHTWLIPAIGYEVSRGGRSFLVGRAGGPQGIMLRLGGGLSVSLPAPDSASDRVVVTGSSVWCAGRDYSTADADLAGVVLDVLGLDVTGRRVSLSRADLTADFLMSEVDAADFFALARSDAVVTRARDRSAFQRGKRWTGSKFGRQSVVLRLYDKLAEVVQKGALPAWLQLWGLDRVPDGFVVVRVEWQLRGAWLRERGIGSVADLLAGVGTLLTYLNASWFRLAGPPRGADHKRDALPVWAAVAALMASGSFSGIVGGVKLVRAVSVNLDAAMKQAAGVLAWLGSCIGHNADDGVIPDAGEVVEYVRKRVHPDWWSARVGQRMVAARYA